MGKEYIEVDLTRQEKAAILKYAGFFVMDETTNIRLSDDKQLHR